MKIFLFVLLSLVFTNLVSAQARVDDRLKNLVVRARVLEAKIDRSEEKYPRAVLRLEVTFTNEGSEPIIILQKIGGYNGDRDMIFARGINIYGKNQSGVYPIQTGGALPSICPGCNEHLAKILDQKAPPAEHSKILKSKESVALIEEMSFNMSPKTSNGQYGWDEIAANGWKLTGRIEYSMFPTNLGRGSNFAQNLQKRWKEYGILYVDGLHSLIASEEFEIDLTGVKF